MRTELPDTLRRALVELARTPLLLVASDYDGTLAPIVSDPAQAKADRPAIVALRQLSEMPLTHVAVVSGRSLAELSDFLDAPDGFHLVGSHGSEFDADFAHDLPQEARALRSRIEGELETIASQADGLTIERKPASVALHYRNASDEDGARALAAVRSGPAAHDGITVKEGKMVIELCVVDTDKGRAIERIRWRLGASATFFIGDDVTDEDAFNVLCGPDVGVKVGEGETAARFRVDDQSLVQKALALLAEEREKWLEGADAMPIERHSMLSDQRTVALVDPTGRIGWLCSPRIDSPALFAALLGGDPAGHWTIAPADGGEGEQTYDGDAMTVVTRWGDLTLTDYLDCSSGRPTQRPGRLDLVRVLEGRGRVRVTFAPRLDFGRAPTGITPKDGGLAISGAHDTITLFAPGVDWDIRQEGRHHTAVAEFDMDGGPFTLEMRHGTGSLKPGLISESQRRTQTARYWGDWAANLTLPERHRDLVRRSAVILRGLCFGPSGAIAAAGTTSLPEWLGGVRNWDYRYCWPRDAAMTAGVLVRLGSMQEAMRLLDWIAGVIDHLPSPEALAPIYSVTGAELGPEGEIGELPGYCASRPVRVGNSAAQQVQLDVFGPITELVWLLAERGAPLSVEHWRLVRAMAEAVKSRWEEPDHGIWEPRIAPRQHVHTKVMCWLTIDRAQRVADLLMGETPDGYADLADRIRAEALEQGWDEQMGTFTHSYAGRELDASVLWTGLSGMVAPDDERFIKTVDAVERGLREGATVYRYRYDDGLPGPEGGFNICTTWLIRSLALVGRHDEAESLFEAYAALAGPTGLLSEEYDPRSGRALGNVPQAYSHLGLIEAALALSGT
ncbi:MAG: trehalose-phosphatase [Phycisphaerales bacterium]